MKQYELERLRYRVDQLGQQAEAALDYLDDIQQRLDQLNRAVENAQAKVGEIRNSIGVLRVEHELVKQRGRLIDKRE